LLNILLSDVATERLRADMERVMEGRPYRLVTPSTDLPVDIAFISRDVTGASTKTRLMPSLSEFYVPLRASARLAWVHTHSAGADRPIFPELLQRGVKVTTSSGANAGIVAQSALGGLLALARRFPYLSNAQREHAWRPLLGNAPRDLAGQTALIVGFGPIGRRLCQLLEMFDMKALAVRREAGSDKTISFAQLDEHLPRCDWLILACPLTKTTHRLIDARRLALMPDGAHLVNIARGEVVVEADLIVALQQQKLAGAYLDVFEHEPLDAASPLWDLPNVIVSPHSAAHSSGNYEAVGRMWIENLGRWSRGEPLLNEVAFNSGESGT
jgi:phosphoglycerate dehydrogenase-like enzyme